VGANRGIHAKLPRMILVVEDEPLVSRCVVLLANQFGRAQLVCTAAAACNALSAMEDWSAFVIDVGLPDGSGMDVLAQARQVHPRTPALVLTGLLSPEVANAAFDLGAACVAKPVSTGRLSHFLQEALSGTRMPDILYDAARAWAALYGLSFGETDVLLKAANGALRDEIAECRGSSSLTVKGQERRVHEKTGDASFHGAVSRLLLEALWRKPNP
jgi:DNA-binding NarL/FixJ family response regulator